MAHSERQHAILSASSAERWLSCTPSARLEERFNQSNPKKSSIHADEGTLAHELAELKLRYLLGRLDEKTFNKELKKIEKNELYKTEMADYVDGYVQFVLDKFALAQEEDPLAEILLESKLDFSNYVENGFGTGDAVIYANKVVMIIDLKYGKGVEVDASNNPQLRLYGIGAANLFSLYQEVKGVAMYIVQPRLNSVSAEALWHNDLIEWAETVVKPTAEKAYIGEGEQVAGKHCKFCAVKGLCRAFADANLELAKHEFKDPQLLSPSEIANVYNYIPMLQDWANAVGEYMLSSMLQGETFEGYKLVEGKSNRKWADDQKVTELLSSEFDPRVFTTTKLKGIADIQTIVGKEFFAEKLASLVVKPEGAPTIVPDWDKRPEYKANQIERDFSEPLSE